MKISPTQILFLIGVNLVYACTTIFTKMASRQEMMSWPYLLWIAGSVGVIGMYAIPLAAGHKAKCITFSSFSFFFCRSGADALEERSKHRRLYMD